MIYYHQLDNNKDKHIQKMNLILIAPKRKLQIKYGKYIKRILICCHIHFYAN